MRIKDAIAYVDSVKPNAFDDAAKILWLNEVEGLVQTEAMLFAVADLIEYTAETDPETELLVRSPHDKIYRAYLVAMVDFANGEYNRYANTVEMFNTYFSEYVVWYADKYRPADGGAVDDGYYITAYGIAVKHGFEGDEAAWLETLKGEPGRGFEIRGKYDTVEQLQAAVTGPEIGDAYAVGTAEPYHVFIWGVDGWFDFGTLKGEPGRDGRDGADGYTPKKGVDYFTDADKAEIAREAAKLVEIPDVSDDDAVKYTPEERSEAEQEQARENIGAASADEVAELRKTIPKVYDWAIAKLPFTEAQISNTASGAGFVVNPTNFADGKTYFRYHAGPTSFAWTNPNPQKGAVTIKVLGWSQYADKATANAISRLNIVYADGSTGSLQMVNGQTVTMTTDANKVLTKIKGNYDHENWVLLDMDALSIVADYPAPTGTVKSVNGNLPDEDGNVEIDIPEGGGGGGTTDHTLGLSGAAVGQIARITAVDGDGVPTKWESANLPSGGSGGEKWDIHYKTNIAEPLAEGFEITEVDGEPLQLKEMWAMVKLQNGSETHQWLGCAVKTDNGNANLSSVAADFGGAHTAAGKYAYFVYHAIVIGNGRAVCEIRSGENRASKLNFVTNGPWLNNWLDYCPVQYITGIVCANNLGAGTAQGYGTEIELWGVRA